MSSFKFEGAGAIRGSDLKKLLSDLIGSSEREEERKVKRSIPAKKEWIKMHSDISVDIEKCKKLIAQVEQIMHNMEADRKKWWATIELGMNDFTTDKRYNEDTKEIEILADKDDGKKVEKDQPIPSPFQTARGKK